METHDLTLANKYARAFLHLFRENITSTSLEQTEQLIRFLKEHKKLFFYLSMPDVSDELRTEILYQLLNYFSLKTTYSSLADLLVAQKRISLLPLILTRINEEYKDSTNSMEFSVESTLDLNSQEIEELKKFLSQKTGKHITLTFTKNPLLIAGIKLYSRQYCWENSIKKQLKALQHRVLRN